MVTTNQIVRTVMTTIMIIKQNRTTLGMGMEIIVPKDRKTTFESQVVRNARKIFRLRNELTVKTNFV